VNEARGGEESFLGWLAPPFPPFSFPRKTIKQKQKRKSQLKAQELLEMLVKEVKKAAERNHFASFAHQHQEGAKMRRLNKSTGVIEQILTQRCSCSTQTFIEKHPRRS
jgi:hypothetical protein